MSHKLRFGILGTGNIARQFADGVAGAHDSVIAAVASRTQEKADAFATDCRGYGSYDALLADPNVDAVYVSLPNNLHHQWTLKALAAGKHVLCEKPLASNVAEAEEMFDAAEKAGRLLVEAFMYRSHPLIVEVVDQVRRGAIGKVRLVRTSFCYFTRNVDDNIRFDPALAGGALMDIGCYCIDLSQLIVGAAPSAALAAGHMHARGVDDLAAGVLQYPGGEVASFTCGMRNQIDNTAYISGEDGYIEVPIPWKPPVEGATYVIGHSIPPRMDGGANAPPPRRDVTVDCDRPLYALEADHFADAVAGRRDVAITRDESLSNMRVLDEIRRQLG